MKIDILLATYNGATHLAEQLKSIEDQTNKDWRLIVRDDGSADGTLKILEETAARLNSQYGEGKMVVLRNTDRKEPKAKSSKSRNSPIIKNFAALLEWSQKDGKANYIMFSDQDDKWYADKVERSLNKMHELERRHEGETNVPLLVHSDANIVDRNGVPIDSKGQPVAPGQKRLTDKERHGTNPETTTFRNELVQCTTQGCTMMLNRPLADLAMPIPDACRMHDMWIGLLAVGAGERGYLKEPTLDYRQHESNALGGRHNRGIMAMYDRVSSVLDEFVDQAEAVRNRAGDRLLPARRHDLDRFLEIADLSQPTRGLRLAREGFTRASTLENAALFGGTWAGGRSKGSQNPEGGQAGNVCPG